MILILIIFKDILKFLSRAIPTFENPSDVNDLEEELLDNKAPNLIPQ